MKKLSSFLVILLFSFIAIFPILYIISVSLRGDNAFASRSLDFFTSTQTIKNYVSLITETDFLVWLQNSLFISMTTTAMGVALASLAGYALSRFKLRGRKVLLFSLLSTQMFPATMLMLPFFILLSKLNLMNSFAGLFLIYSSSALPFCIWQMKAYYDSIPRELEEAALLDGCPPFKTFYLIILPLALPALVITGLFSFMTSWSEYMVAAVVLQNPDLYTLPLGLKSFQSSLATQWGLYSAASLIVSVPIVVFFIITSRYLVSGLTIGSVKG